MNCEYVGTAWRNNRRDECSFSGVRGHLPPGYSIKVGRRYIVPAGAETVVGGAVAGRLVLGDRFSACGECFQIG